MAARVSVQPSPAWGKPDGERREKGGTKTLDVRRSTKRLFFVNTRQASKRSEKGGLVGSLLMSLEERYDDMKWGAKMSP